MDPWILALVDVPRSVWDTGRRFWSAATGWPASDATGAVEELPSLVPAAGDPWVLLQAVGGAAGVHLDLATPDLHRAAEGSLAAGGTLVSTAEDLVVLRSPGGLAHCRVGGGDGVMVRPTGPAAVLLDQVCLDVPAPLWDVEVAYWERVTGRGLEAGSRPEFATLHPTDPSGGLRLLLQRLDSTDGPVRAHLDLAASDRAAETDRHLGLGATTVDVRDRWTVLRSPDGQVYCLTDRDPTTGRVLTRRP